MKFSICIPNYNYEKYLGCTIQSILDQTFSDFEIVIADNASTDRSVEIAKEFNDERIKIKVNQQNVGFAGNLDKAAEMATGDYLIMLSSDDVMKPNALETYSNLINSLGDKAEQVILCAETDVIDPDDKVIGSQTIFPDFYDDAEILDDDFGKRTVLEAHTVLNRALSQLKNPLFFLSTCYSRKLYQEVEGYSGKRLMNPDKWFNWKILAEADSVQFFNIPLFSYRWHPNNQTALQKNSGALKYLVDQYSNVLEVSPEVLKAASLQRSDLEEAFIEYDICRHGLKCLTLNQTGKARRIKNLGKATYPHLYRKNSKAYLLSLLTCLGPIGFWVAKLLYQATNKSENTGFDPETA